MIATSLIPLDTIFLEICAFIIGFSCTARTKMRSLTGSLADGVLAECFQETRDQLSSTYNLKVMSRCLSAPDAISIHHCLKNKQLKLIMFQW